MRRAHEYVTIYEDDKLSSIIPRERYDQQVLDRHGKIKEERTLLSDYLLVRCRTRTGWPSGMSTRSTARRSRIVAPV